MKNRSTPLFVLAVSAACLVPAAAVEITKASNTNLLTDGPSWVGGVAPGPADVALFDSTLLAANSTDIGGSILWDGIRVTNPAGPVILSNLNTPSTPMVSIGASGIDMSVATAPFLIEGAFAVTANQTWSVANASAAGAPFTGAARQFNNNEDLAFSAGNTPGAGILFDLGGNAVTTVGAGTIVVTSGYFITNGTINVGNTRFEIQGGASKLGSLGGFVTMNVAPGAELMYQSTSGGLESAATVNLNGGTLRYSTNNAVRPVDQSGVVNVNQNSTILVANQIGGNAGTGPLILSGNLTGSANLAFNNTAANSETRLQISGDNSGFSGTATFGGTAGRSTRLTSFTAGSAAATWNVTTGHTLEVDGVTVSLGTLNGGGTVANSGGAGPATVSIGAGSFSGAIQDGAGTMGVTKVGPGRLDLTGQNFYTGATRVNAGALYLTPNSFASTAVTVADGATFGVQLTPLGGALFIPSLTVGATAGGTVAFDTGGNALSATAPLSTPIFNPVAPSVIQISGAGLVAGTFPLLDYDGAIGGVGFTGLSLALPPRVAGMLVNNAAGTSIDLAITGQDFPKWTGAVDGNWDIDDGTGTGTANWREVTSGNATRYIQTPTGADAVLFDDTATGPTAVNLTAALTPAAITVDNSTLTYEFTGSGSLGGSAPLTKTGTGTLIIRNTGPNTYTGATIVTAGTVQIGDGVTAGGGSLGTGFVDLAGTLVLNRPDDFVIAGSISGAGTLTKQLGSTVTLPGAVNLDGPVGIAGGALSFGGGGNLTGAVTGAGGIGVTGATLQLGGIAPNTYTGLTSVTAGTLQLNKGFGVNAVGGDISITGTGVLQTLAGEQIPDTASLTFNSDGGNTTLGNETFANGTISGPVTGVGPLIANTGFVSTGTITINGRVFSIASSHSATANAIVITGGTLRIAANSGNSTLDVGIGGIVASGGLIQVGQGLGANDAVLNLAGDYAATANMEIARGNFFGLQKREINLIGDRKFTIAQNTTTLVRPEVAGTGGLIKEGAGTLRLLGASAYTGGTTINAGTLATSTLQTGTPSVTVADGATLAIGVNSPGESFTTGSLTLGNAAGAMLALDLGSFGNPTAPVVSTSTLATFGNAMIALLGVTTPGTFSLIDYSGTIGGGGFASLGVTLPPRVAGSLVDNAANTSVDLRIDGVDSLRWNGTVNASWDIDTTANWKGTLSGTDFTYLETSTGSDSVLFNDLATGPASINIVTTVSPLAVTVDSATLNYQFGGAGLIAGSGALTKSGASTLTILTENTYTGGTTIAGGTVNVGAGTAAGSLGAGPIANNAALIFDRTNDVTLTNALSGAGTLTKRGAGQLVIQGTGFNSNTGLTTVEAGTLRLNRTPGSDALGGDIVVNSGTLQWSQANQLPDTASVTVNNDGRILSGNLADTLTNVTINAATPVSTISGFNITGILTITAGNQHDLVNTTGTLTANRVVMSNTNGRLGVNTNAMNLPTTLNIGIGGVSLTDATIVYGSNGNAAQMGIVNLDGDVTGSGTGGFVVASGNPMSRLDLGFVSRTFEILDGVTTVDAAIVSFSPDAGVIKTGPGTLRLSAGTNTNGASTYTGPTTVQAGTLLVNGSIAGSTVTVAAAGTLSGAGTINGDVTVNGTLAPGDPAAFGLPGILTLGTTDLTFGSAASAVFELPDFFTFDRVAGIDRLTLDGTVTVSLINGFQPIMGDTFDLLDFATIDATGFNPASDLVLPALSPGLGWDSSNFLTQGVIAVVPEPVSAATLLAGLGLLAGLRRRRGQPDPGLTPRARSARSAHPGELLCEIHEADRSDHSDAEAGWPGSPR